MGISDLNDKGVIMTYKLVKISDNKFHVIETASENVIAECRSYEDAHKIYRNYKTSKKGFLGWTPKFFLQKGSN
jgi:hypothetical protein